MAGGAVSEDFPAHLSGFRAGMLVAGYRLEAQLGAGGMAVVFRARDERLGRPVALKILAPGLATDPEFRRRFILESRAAAVVDDPHIIPVHEAGEANGVLFIAMRFVAGGDLRGVLGREGPLGPGRTAGFVSPVASALDAAHRAGLVHRDVKPANILVDARPDRPDHVYLSDFGVSKGAVSSVSLTGTGQFLGTPDYSAPEQIQGRVVDGRTDQYALACVAYQLLTGWAPFQRDQGMAVLLAHLSEPPPSLGSRRPGLPAAADQVLARAMAKVPEKRYGSCREFADALRQALGLPPYMSGDSVSAPRQWQPPVAAPPSGLSWWDAAGTKTSAAAAGPVRAPTGDYGQSASQTAQQFPPGPGHRAGGAPGGGSRQRRKGRPWAVAGGIAAAAAVIAVVVLLKIPSPGPAHTGSLTPAHSASSSPKRTVSPSPAPSVGQFTLSQLRAGDCVTGSDLSLDENTNSVPSTYEVVPCAREHITEVFYGGNYWAASQAYQGEQTTTDQADAECAKVFATYVGVTEANSSLSVHDEIPGSGDWATGDRDLVCMAYSSTSQYPGGAPMYGSIRGSDE